MLYTDLFYRVKLHLEPLAIAINVTQQAKTWCDQVLILLGQLHHVYTSIIKKDCTSPDADYKDEDHPCTSILKSLEKCWIKADQDLFIGCVFLNPNFKNLLFNPQKMTTAMIIGILRQLYMCIFRVQDCPAGFIEEIMHYVRDTGIYSHDMWCIDELLAYMKGCCE